jgi:hypothetical protein
VVWRGVATAWRTMAVRPVVLVLFTVVLVLRTSGGAGNKTKYKYCSAREFNRGKAPHAARRPRALRRARARLA